MSSFTNPRAPMAAILDDLEAIRILDRSGMLTLTEEFPAQCADALEISEAFVAQLKPAPKPASVVITGLGGSAIGGDLVASLAMAGSDVPVIVNRDYDLPGFAGKDTLVIASSYSGNTEETLSAYSQARAAGCRIVCVTSGGELGKMADADGVPVCRVPGGRPPRASTGYLFIPTLSTVAAHTTFDDGCSPAAVRNALPLLQDCARRWSRNVPLADNPAKQLAVRLHGRIPIFYGTQGYRGVLAVRWKGQFNENAKAHAFANVLPEQNHNEILGWDQALTQSQHWSVVYLRDPLELTATPRIAKRVEVLRTVIGNRADQMEAWAEGVSLVERMLSLMYLGDFASVYAALLNGVDPTAIAGIDLLKAELARMPD
jgi:glucose/mannose-6-phosphate isomerase